MTNYAKKEERVLNKITKTMDKLDDTLAKMDETESKIKEFYEQEKAIHEVRVIVSKAKKIDRLEDEAIQAVSDEVIYKTDEEIELAQEIDAEFDKLEKALDKYDETDSKAKGYLEQKKALHEARIILKKADKLENL